MLFPYTIFNSQIPIIFLHIHCTETRLLLKFQLSTHPKSGRFMDIHIIMQIIIHMIHVSNVPKLASRHLGD